MILNKLKRRVTTLLHLLAFDDNSFARSETIRLRAWNCKANLRGVPTKGQGLYEATHARGAMPFENLPAHIRDCYENHTPVGFRFRGNNSAYRSRL